jgi:elongation factor 2
MARKEFVVEEVQKLMGNVENIRNVAIVAHVDHGKTTLTDSLVARAGLISKELAGQQRVMDFDAQEAARGITIKSANISLGFNYEGKDYLVNLIDTPGHVDFGFHVVRAMRAVDGVCLVVDAVEGVMPQTETNLRQALKERAKPVLFINKIDRLINELKFDSAQMQQRFIKIITQVNKIIEANAPPEMKDEWTIKVDKGNVAFGTAYNKWAVSFSSMKKFNIAFKDIYDKCVAQEHAWLVERSPLDEVMLEMIVKHLPNPSKAQPYRTPTLWKNGDIASETGKSMVACDPKAKVVGVCFGVVYDEHAGEVAVVRLFSGTIDRGTQLYVSSKKVYAKVQQIGIYMGPDRVAAERIIAGNIGAVVGLKDVYVGETLSSDIIEPFEQIKHYSEPVITKSLEVKDQKDLPKLIDALRSISKEDPTIKIALNKETGEHLVSGNGELHLEIIEYKIKIEKKIDIITSPPIVVYKETITGKAGPVEGKSPNKHNRLKVTVEPVEPEIMKALEAGEIKEGRPRGKEVWEKLVELGMDRDEAKSVYDIYQGNIFVNGTKGIQYLNEIEELMVQGFEEAMNQGPLAKEKVTGVKVILSDATLHEDNVHRGPAQMIPAIKRPIYAAILMAGVALLEPKQKVLINTLQDYAGNVITLTNGRRGTLMDMQQEGENTAITTMLPVAEMFGFANDLRGATQGRAIWYQEYAGCEPMPRELTSKVVRQIRERKGEQPEPPSPAFFLTNNFFI